MRIKDMLSSKICMCIAIFLISFFLFTGTMHFFYTIDSLPNNLTASNYLFNKRIDLNNLKKGLEEKKLFWIMIENSKGIVYSKYTPLVGLLSVPTFWLSNKYFGVNYISEKQLVFSDYVQYLGKLTASIYAALSTVLMFLILLKINENKLKENFVLTLVYFLCTNIFNTASQANFQHAFSLFFINLFLLLFIAFPQKKVYLIITGLIAGIFSQIRFTNSFYLIFVILFYFLNYRKSRKLANLIFFLGPFLLAYLAILLMNLYLQLPNGYLVEIKQSLSLFTISSLFLNMISLLFSYNYGLFFFSPILILGLLSLWKIIRKGDCYEKKLIISLLPTLLIFIISASSWWGWTGGRALNARLLTETVPILVIFLSYSYKYFNRRLIYKLSFIFLFILSFSINVLTTYFIDKTLIWYDLYTIHDPKGILTPQYERRNAWYSKPTLLGYLVKNKSARIVRLYKKGDQIMAREIVLRPSLRYLNVRKISDTESVILNLTSNKRGDKE